MTRLTYLQNRTVYYSLFVAALLGIAPDEIYGKVAPIFFTGEDEALERLVKSEELNQLRSTAMLELYQNYIVSFCEDPNTFGRRKSEMEAIKLKYHVLSIIEELQRSPTASLVATLCENYDKNMSVAYAIALYCSNPRAKTAYTTALKKALRDADGLDACIALLYLEQGRKEWLEALSRNETAQFYPDVREIVEQHYRVLA